MKCYFREGDGEWIKGFVDSHQGGTCVEIVSEDREISYTIRNTEILFQSYWMSVCGYMLDHKAEQTYKLVSLDVSGSWSIPPVPHWEEK